MENTLNRDLLTNHLENIYAEGQIDAVWLSEDLSTTAVDPEGNLVVEAPPLPHPDDVLAQPIGLTGSGLRNLLEFLRRGDSEMVRFDHVPDVTASYQLSFSYPYRFSPGEFEDLDDGLPDVDLNSGVAPSEVTEHVDDKGVGAPLLDETVSALLGASRVMAGTDPWIVASEDFGVSVDFGDHGQGTSASVHMHFMPEREYSVQVDGECLHAAVSCAVRTEGQTRLVITGRDSIVAVQSGQWIWALDPVYTSTIVEGARPAGINM